MLTRYARWLHTQWPAGRVEPLPDVREDGATGVPGLYVAGDLRGIPLLKFAADSGARVVRTIAGDPDFARRRGRASATADIIIVGAGVAGVSAALEAKRLSLKCVVLESASPFSTIANFPVAKPIFTYPTDMEPAGELRLTAPVKESLLGELLLQMRVAGIEPVAARCESVQRAGALLEVALAGPGGGPMPAMRAPRVILAIGRSGEFRRLGVPGEDLGKVANRLHDPSDFAGRRCLVVGGGDSALEAATALHDAGAEVILSHRGASFGRAKPENAEAVTERGRGPAPLRVSFSTRVAAITPTAVELVTPSGNEVIPNDCVFTLIGREAPLDFLRRCGVRIQGEWTRNSRFAFAAFVLLCVFVYNWKASGDLKHLFESRGWFPHNVAGWFRAAGGAIAAKAGDPASVLGTLAITLGDAGFYYSLAYTLAVAVFGVRRIRRRRTPYITAQTLALMAFQVLPLFLLPYILLPLAGHNGWFSGGIGKTIADNLFPSVNYGHGREYWRAFGLILAWPLFIWNFLTEKPMAWWLVIGSVQTFVLIPLLIRFWGKGAYCGWICSCGALAETLGDTHRHKMPHGPGWNRLNLVGQVVLAAATLLFLLRVITWIIPGSALVGFYGGLLSGWKFAGVQANYYWLVDVTLAGIVGVGFYFWYSGRVWCRFACPLAALMHIYARFSRFRILSEKKKCISCNVCTSVCHQGIDIMNFANKGRPMEDPECVRCSACVHACPTGVLSFGQVGRDGGVLSVDRLAASPVRMREGQGAGGYPDSAEAEAES